MNPAVGHDPQHAKACNQGEVNVCRWLCKHGAAADVSTCDSNSAGFTPLLVACEKVHLSVCKWLFARSFFSRSSSR